MSDDQIPDPTDLRRKLGLIKAPPVRPTIHDFAQQGGPGELSKLSAQGVKDATLADYEPFPREVDQAESDKIDQILAKCPPASALWLKKYIVLGNRSAASRAINYSAAMGSWWKRQYPEFSALLSFYEEEVRCRWNEVAERRALAGFTEDVFKPDGSLKFTRVRQDPQFMKAMMQRMDPDWRDADTGTQITITVNRTDE